MTNQTPNSLSPQGVPNNFARCLGSRSYEDGEWHWREGCDDCQRRIVRAGVCWIEPPPIIAFECEYRIGPDEIVAQREHAPGPEPLSPAAEAVLVPLPHQVHRYVAAAVLRAAEHEIDAPLGITCLTEEQERWYMLGVANFKRKLLAIATELEGLATPQPEPPTDEELLALQEKLWERYKLPGFQGEEFMWESGFVYALSDYRAALERWGQR